MSRFSGINASNQLPNYDIPQNIPNEGFNPSFLKKMALLQNIENVVRMNLSDRFPVLMSMTEVEMNFLCHHNYSQESITADLEENQVSEDYQERVLTLLFQACAFGGISTGPSGNLFANR